MSLAIRISMDYESIKEWINGVECEKMLVYQHDADDTVNRTHVHLLIIKPEKKPDALKTRYVKMYNPTEKGNSLWSWKSTDINSDVYITYMTNGHLEPMLNKGYNVEELKVLKDKWINPKTTNVELVDGKLVRSVKTVVKKTKREMLEQMRSGLSDSSTTRDILKELRKVLINNNEVVGQYKMMDYYDSYMMYFVKEDWMCAMEAKINSKYNV